ncbi:AAA family ATPase [Roseofilum reptotaenium CS-1145]|uniref:ATPase AAA-type core domain-containing protein n=1 Tax=Roseofilum reptotaenium AO1-A TaxID=1925591 RepID=A0A1L9QWL3_9CYAN|nr:AAA family ATPase [Roseofilum reptotaenium]MDB9518523.1 AAA family ATPase [Roseofilum reptotaenium CS-1145]OJJ27070.1 hypothetical protein BI308_03195 [Roseofilum reptotaenium AO1-A]
MLKSFYIKNFRIFRQLEIKSLSHVNLIVGKNNVGKSTFLEAIRIYASRASQDVLFDLTDRRQENWFKGKPVDVKTSTLETLRHLFFNHQLPKMGEEGIFLSEEPSIPKFHINLMPYQIQQEQGLLRKVPVALDALKSNGEIPDIVSSIIVHEEGKKPRLIDLKVFDNKLFSIPLEDNTIPCQSIPMKKNRDHSIAQLWDLTSLTPLKSEVISGLNLIERRITDITFVQPNGNQSGSLRIPLVKLEGIDEPLPMKTLGDGVNHLFEILLCLVNSKNGFLLIDELENGLHWTVQPKVWEIIFQLAERLNVQVFATTHSYDCVKSFGNIWNQYPELGSAFRLESKQDNIKATEYTLERLMDSLESAIYVR